MKKDPHLRFKTQYFFFYCILMGKLFEVRFSGFPLDTFSLFCHSSAMNNSSFKVPVENRYLEDYEPGSVHEFGTIAVEEADIIEFARCFDPQIFHTVPQAARDTIYGGLIASGWHTASMMMRLFVDYYLSGIASLGSPGVDELRWKKPVRPGDALSLRVTVMETKRSRSKPDRGVLTSFIEVINQKHDVVMSMQAVNMLLCRQAS